MLSKSKRYINKIGRFIPLNTVKINNKVSWRLVGEAFAQGCSGTINCGEERSYSFCTNSTYNYVCNASNTGSACGPGTCLTGYYCEESVNDLNCSSLSSQNVCENATAGNSCSPPFCNNSADNSCSWGGGPTGGACGPGSAGACQDQNVGAPCGDGGTCKNAPNCSCQVPNVNECGGGGTIKCTVPGGSCNYYQDSPAVFCGWDYDYDPREAKYQMCCGCTATIPGKPIQTAPANGATASPGLVRLDWDPIASWGVGCPENLNRYQIYAAKTNPPTTKVSETNTSVTQYDYSAATTGTYYWYVLANNGTRTNASAVRSFVVANPSCTVSVTPDHLYRRPVPVPAYRHRSLAIGGQARFTAISNNCQSLGERGGGVLRTYYISSFSMFTI